MYRKEKESQVVRRVKGSDHLSYSAQLSRLIAWAGVTCCGMYSYLTDYTALWLRSSQGSPQRKIHIYMYILFVTPAHTGIHFCVVV